MGKTLEECVWYLPAQMVKEFETDLNIRKESRFNYEDVGCDKCDGKNKYCDRYAVADGCLLSHMNRNTPSRLKHDRENTYEDERYGVHY